MKKLLNKRKKRVRLFVLLGLFAILFIGIGYSYLRETLTINSNTEISSMRWDVHFANLDPKSGSVIPVRNPSIGSDGLSVTVTLDFTQPGEFYEYEVDVVNGGTIDAMIGSYDSTVLTEAQAKYLTYSATYSDGKPIEEDQLLRANTRETIKVRIEVKEDLEKTDLPGSDDEFRITFKLNYIQADEEAEDRLTKHASITRQNEGVITKGDEVVISRKNQSEKFIVVDSTNEKLILATKYCLDSDGKQVSGNQYEQIAFSSSDYWNDGGIKNEYLKDVNGNEASTSGNPYPYVYDSNSNLKAKVDAYATKVGKLGVNVLKSRIMSYEEANALPSSSSDIENQTYWTGSLTDLTNGELSIVPQNQGMMIVYSPYSYTFGIRPVIEIGMDELAD